ncbi:uncharacterized protein LACBIDRAFT_304256 [Laccaria bicolor S238N-H82]|uniref:Uncharacterized protein n=1 Tax=Laccaria bicolor (strain S238N-H82 / ATCC MYA-4686) TaxID=486041 RepID=B0DL83_LACBS|nr:uncharacterized protein LACBIDRAFT_304256 [Laccaria bicolor S238N-H82]EDR04517.1 hypothetical protein LACBIDRAFT_304256 [Laccaria bicolor S238N-H82]|eukprot:XP_001884689.1 hypothetical protein LACBIDRAFT_304256 [Laccaria bicolor S238N-H82]
MTQGKPLTQNPKISSTHNANSFKFALFKNAEALAIPDASRQSVFSFQAPQRTQAESSSQSRLSALFLSDVHKPSKAPGNILQARDVGQGEAQEGGRDASSPLPASPKSEGRTYIQLASRKPPPNRPSPTASHREREFWPEYSRENDRTASLTLIPGESNHKTSRRQSPALSGAHTSSSPPPSRPSSRSQAVFPCSKNDLRFNSIADTSLKPQQTPPIAKRDVKRAFSDLLEHNHHYEALFAESIALQTQNEYLSQMRSTAAKDLKFAREELSATAAQLASARSELAGALPLLKSTENELSTAKSDLALTRSNLADAVAEISSLKTSLEQMAHSYEQEKLVKEVTEKRLVTAKQGLATLRENYQSLHSSFIALGKSHEASEASLSQAVAEATEIKLSAADALTSVKPLLEVGGGLSRASEMRDTIQELQGELGSSQRVNDLLRDKLHHLSSQLVDAQARIKDFEDTERGTLSVLRDRLDDKQSLEVLCSVGTKVEDLTDRLAKHERESIDALAEAAGVEAKLIAVTHELQNMKTSSSANLLELQELRVIKEEGLSKLLASQEVINAKDKEIIGLKAEVKALGESKAELRALSGSSFFVFGGLIHSIRVVEAKKAVTEKDRELRARDSNTLMEQKVEDLNSQVVSAEASLKITREWLALAQSEARERKEESDVLKTRSRTLKLLVPNDSTKEALAVRTSQLVQTEIKRVTAEAKKAGEEVSKTIESLHQANRRLEKRLDEQDVALVAANDINNALQTAALTLAKDQITANEAGVQEIIHNLRTELAVAHEQKLALERETTNLKASFNQLTRESAASLAVAQVDFEKKMNKQEKANERLVSAQEKRAVADEKAATLAENDAKEARVVREELAGRLALAEMSVIAIAEDGEAAATRESGQMKVMKARAEELEARVGEMMKHAETLLSRYHDANLTDLEKDLVNHIILQVQTLSNIILQTQTRTSSLRRTSFEDVNASQLASIVEFSLWTQHWCRCSKRGPRVLGLTRRLC